uniref:D-aminoacyl-tRNA deacylase n=1 Tax=Ndongobacter massiliensis TaxID=1871025 RepID=UPI000930E0A3|nr:D-aminoacyl-tRNA deacylase [Ndongobacter massiliensis]
MRAVVQRVKCASIDVEGKRISQIEQGLAVLVGVETGDQETDAKWLAEKLAHLRIFEDEAGKLNRSVQDVTGAMLLVSQFTLLGDAKKGRRPSFVRAEKGERSKKLFETVAEHCRSYDLPVQTGVFGADMQFSLVNDGPVTILLDSRRPL